MELSQYPQLLFIKVVNVKNSKVLNGIDGGLVCDLVLEGGSTEYQPFDVVFRRPKSNGGIQKNTYVFHLPQPQAKFQLTFRKKTNSKDTQQQQQQQQEGSVATANNNNNINTPLAKVNVSLQYSSLPSLPRRSSYNSLAPAGANTSSSSLGSLVQALPISPLVKSNDGSGGSPQISPRSLNSETESVMSSAPPSPVVHGRTSSTSSPMLINNNNNNNNSATPSPALSSVGGGSPSLSGSPHLYPISNPPPYSLSAPSSPSEMALSGSPSFISYNNGNRYQNNPVPISSSASTSSPTLATAVHGDEEQIKIESSLKWYKLAIVPSSSGNSNSNGNGLPTSTSIHGGMVNSTSYTSLAGLHTQYTIGSESDGTLSSDESEIQLHISYEHSNVHNLTKIKSYHKDLLELIVSQKNKLAMVHAMCDSVDITGAQQLGKSLVDVFHSHHKLLHLLKSFIKKEVSLCHDPGTLFRSNSVAMKMVVAYGYKTAQHYLQQILTPLVVDLCNSPLSLEVDPVKLPPGEDAELNLKNLRIVSQKFFDRIVQSIEACPKSVIEICYYFKKIVSRKFPTHWKSAVGGFIFLRLFCPACVSPENHGIISPGRVGITERRALVLVAKCLQNLSNQVLFNQPYMESVNDFIHSNTPALEDYFIKLATRPGEDQTIDGMNVNEESLYDGIVYLQTFLEKNQEKIFKALEANTSLQPNERPKQEKVMEAVEASKKAVISSTSSLSAIIKGRSNSAGSSTLRGNDTPLKKPRSNSDNKEPKWSSTISKNLSKAKQTVITPTLNVISSFPKSQDEEIKVINLDFNWEDGSPRPIHIVATGLLRNLTILCKNNKLSDTQSLKISGQPLSWSVVQQTPEFATFSHQIHELQTSYFESTSTDYITAVFINIFNILVIHLHFLLGPPNSEIRRKMYGVHKYNVAGELYSLGDIQHGILRANPKNSLSRTRQIRGGDKRRAYVLPTIDPRIHFALFAVNITIPCLRIFNPETLVEDLHKCGEEFCSSKIEICIKKKEISLPKVFSHYGTDFGKSRSEMLKWVFQFLTSGKRTELLELLEKPSFICLYRGESWNPITYKTKFINDLEEKQQAEKETEKKLQEKEKMLRRKSRSLTHGNRLASGNNRSKDSSTSTLINSLKQSALNSNKQILTTLNDVVKTVSECLDHNFVLAVLEILKTTAKQLSFNEWQKSSLMTNNNSNSSFEKPAMMLKPHHQLFSNMQNYCLSPESQQLFSQPLQELYSLSLTIEKEMNKFLDFMEISSFGQSNDINQLLSDISNDLLTQIDQLKITHDSLPNTKTTLNSTIEYFNASLSSKSQLPSSASEENLLSNILQELAIDENPSLAGVNVPLTANKASSSSPIHVSLQLQSKQKQQHMKQLTEKINIIQDQIQKCQDIASVLVLAQKVKKIGKWIALYDDHCAGRYSPRNIIKSSC
ncbi:hypothetical protein CYY_005542 [Polysphondylium violaceum]|uniref:Ras-GAP domain-containing protein n=1 Tax=Polysphondylium violaceum TaxID=133409 RepID=A0A8J4UZJ5_9MYCE|nr:hypothetical protein CYY_005542 [Polysphondylium violaceum]